MTEKNVELPQTNAAIAGLSEALDQLNEVLSVKAEQLSAAKIKNEAQLKNSEANLELLKNASEKIITNINAVMSRLDKVLENDVSSNDNN